MAEPLSVENFATIVAQAGLTLPPAEIEDLRHAHAKLMDMLALLRDSPIPLAAEPALTFTAGERA